MYAHVSPCMLVKDMLYKVYICNFAGTFLSGTYMAITCEACVVVGSALAHICPNIKSIYTQKMTYICNVAATFVQ